MTRSSTPGVERRSLCDCPADVACENTAAAVCSLCDGWHYGRVPVTAQSGDTTAQP